jgi:hypothetical protein
MATLHVPRLHGHEFGAHPRLRRISQISWSICGATVVLFIFFAAMGAIPPGDALAVTMAVVLLAVAWLVHAWPRLRAEPGSGHARDRERRGS